VATLAEITDRIRQGLQGEPPLDSTLKIDLKGDGFVHLSGDQVTNADAPADCTVVISRDDLEALARGLLDPMTAMMRGRLRIVGDMSVAMKLQSLLRTGR